MSRRSLLASLATLGLAGCLDEAPDDSETAGRTPTGSPTTGRTPSESPTDRPTSDSTATPPRVIVERIDAFPRGEPVVVYPDALREWLARAARGETVRATDGTFTYDPQPILPGVSTVTLTDDEAVAGRYRCEIQGGTYYERQLTATPADPPADATVTPVATLSDPRRELAVAAIDGEYPFVEPQSRLGEWVRTAFFGGYYTHDGQTYRGREAQQTDAAFFATTVWYVLSLTGADTTDATPLQLSLRPVPTAVHRLLDPYFEGETDTPLVVRDPTARQFFADPTLLVTHTGRYRISRA